MYILTGILNLKGTIELSTKPIALSYIYPAIKALSDSNPEWGDSFVYNDRFEITRGRDWFTVKDLQDLCKSGPLVRFTNEAEVSLAILKVELIDTIKKIELTPEDTAISL